MEKHELKYYCKKCKKEIIWLLNADSNVQDEDIDRFTKELACRHNHEEHTYCTSCGDKINPKEARIEVVGRKEPTIEESKSGVVFTLLFGHYCNDCYKRVQEIKEGSKDL